MEYDRREVFENWAIAAANFSLAVAGLAGKWPVLLTLLFLGLAAYGVYDARKLAAAKKK